MTAWQSSTSDRIGTLERDHRALLMAFGAAFVVLLTIFGGGFIAISSKIDAGFAASAQRDEATTASIAELRTDVAVLKADVAVLKERATGSPRSIDRTPTLD